MIYIVKLNKNRKKINKEIKKSNTMKFINFTFQLYIDGLYFLYYIAIMTVSTKIVISNFVKLTIKKGGAK